MSSKQKRRVGRPSKFPPEFRRDGLTADERSDLVLLRAENTQLRMERDLLKRSLAFWVKEQSTP